MSTQDFVFMKQLLDNIEFANEKGVLNVLKLFRHEDPNVTQGTSFALGAFDTLQKIFELRPDLFTGLVIQELQALSQDGNERISSVAQSVLEKINMKQEKTDWLKNGSIVIQEPKEAIRILFNEGLPAVSIVTRADVETQAKIYGKSAPFEIGSREHMEPLLMSYAEYLADDPLHRGYKYFQIEIVDSVSLHCIELKAFFKSSATVLPIWREASDFVAPHTLVFPRPKPAVPTSDVKAAQIADLPKSTSATPTLSTTTPKKWWEFWKK